MFSSTSMHLHHLLNGNSSPRMLARASWREAPMTYSFTQISQYLRCPRQYRYRYLDGWREKEDRASMIFGRCFEKALAASSSRTAEFDFLRTGVCAAPIWGSVWVISSSWTQD